MGRVGMWLIARRAFDIVIALSGAIMVHGRNHLDGICAAPLGGGLV